MTSHRPLSVRLPHQPAIRPCLARAHRAARSLRQVVTALWFLSAAVAGAEEVPLDEQVIVTLNTTQPASIAAADLDGDGDLDVYGALYDDTLGAASLIAWAENTAGDGSTWAVAPIGFPVGPFDAHAADIDSDGDLDIVGAATDDNDILWFENTAGDGSAWSAPKTIDGNFGGARAVVVVDLNNNGELHVLGAASVADDISSWRLSSGGSWIEEAIDEDFDGAYDVAAADIDGDGDLDVLGAGFDADTFAWWDNGPVWAKNTIDAASDGARSVAGGDIDRDGDADVVTAAANDGEITWWENTAGDGSAWTGHPIDTVFDGAASVFVADLDGDGDLDVLGAAAVDDEIAWWENTAGDGSAWTKRPFGGVFDGARSIHAADMDGDGDLDVLGAAENDGNVTWWENETIHRSALFPELETVDATLLGPTSVSSVDVDGDGDLDLLGASFTDAEVVWWENTASRGANWTATVIASSFPVDDPIGWADLDGDGDPDVFAASSADDEVTWWENTAGDGSTWTEHVLDDAFTGAASAVAGDLDGQGGIDIVGAAYGDDELSWWADPGSSILPPFTIPITTTFGGASGVALGDMDGDGDLDVIGAAQDDDTVAWFENTVGDASAWTQRDITTSFDGVNSVAVDDVDGDGDLDVLSASPAEKDVIWFENTNGIGTSWTLQTIADEFTDAAYARAADMDGDGDLDVFSSGGTASDLTWWENLLGDGSSWSQHLVGAGFPASSAHAADLDRDGDLDFAAAAFTTDTVAWWSNRGGQFALATGDDITESRAIASQTRSVLAIEAHHLGRSGEQDIELTTVELLLADDGGTPLTDTDVDDLLASLDVFLDDGSGTFEVGSDTVVASVSAFALASGVLAVPFVDGDAGVAIPFGSTKTYFVTLTFEGDAATADPRSIRVTHLTESSSTAEDADHDIPLVLEAVDDTPSSVLTVNVPPVAVADSLVLFEKSALVPGNVLDGTSGGLDSDDDGDALTATLINGPTNGILGLGGLAASGDFEYAPATPHFNGEDSFTYVADDGFETSEEVQVNITVLPVNDAPGLKLVETVVVEPDAGPQVIPGVVIDASPGAPNETDQIVTVQVIGNSSPGLFVAGPTVGGDGSVSFTSAPGAVGFATVTLQAMDDGGTANGGEDTSAPESFRLVIGPGIFADGFESGDTDGWSGGSR